MNPLFSASRPARCRPRSTSAALARHAITTAATAGLLLALVPSALAVRTEDRLLKNNGQVEYLIEPAIVEHASELFTRGTLHGRARAHAFWWDWTEEKSTGTGQTRDNHMIGLGGSLVARSARWHGWSGTLGFYSTVPLHPDNLDPTVPLSNFGRAGKDTYRTRPDGSEAAINVLAEAFVEFRQPTVSFRAGRQIIDSLLLSANDSKMIPNTFEALRGEWRPAPKTKLGVALVRRAKLRDHSAFHSVIGYAKCTGNDDSGAHKGLTWQNLAAAGRGTEPPLWLLTAEDRSLPNLKLALDLVAIQELFASVAADACYERKLTDGWTFVLGARLLRQWDRGAGAIGGASLTGFFARDRAFSNSAADLLKLASYESPRSLNGGLGAGRIGLARGPWALTLACSRVADQADIVAPWRGFPSGGYTRLIGQVDWLAAAWNRTVRVDYDFGKNRVLSTLTAAAACTWEDFDERKIAAGSSLLTDRAVLSVDLVAALRALPRTAFKLRLGVIRADARPAVPIAVDYESYREIRFEMNRLF